MTKKSVFISHSSKDNEFALWLAGEIKKHDVVVWLDAHKLRPGDPLYGTIGPALKKADHFIIILSKESIDSPWVELELEVALIREKKEKRRNIIIPVLLENVEVPTFIENKKYSDFTSKKNFEHELRDLLEVFGVEFQESEQNEHDHQAAALYPNQFLPDLKFFVGREKLLERIKDTLKKDHRAAIHDISGVGKTFTTYKFADDNQENYDKIFFIRATREEMLETLAKCGEMVDPRLAEIMEQQAKALGFKQWLEENEKWLVIYDNVDLPDELFKYVPVSKRGDCIFTSNFKEVISLVTRDSEIKIEKLNNKDAGVLLYSRAENKPYSEPEFDNEEDQTAFNNLIEEIQGLPLTLNSTGAFISQEEVTYAEFWQRFKDTVWDTEDMFSTYENRQQSKSAGKVFSLVYDELCEIKATGTAVKTILDAVSLISPDEIPADLLVEILKKRYKPFLKKDNPEGFWNEVRKSLTAYDLLKYNKNKKTFTTHRAIQRVIQSRIKGREKEICIGLTGILRGLFPMYDYSNREVCEKFYQHVVILLENDDKFGAATPDSNELYFRAGRYQKNSGNYEPAERSHRRATEISALVFGSESEIHARDLNDLASVYWNQGRYNKAISKLEEALRIDEKTVGRVHPNYATRLSNLGRVYSDQGRYDEAIEKFEEALRLDEKTIGKEHRDYAAHLDNLANVFSNRGRFDEAIEKFEEALHIDEKTIGREHPDYAVHLNNLANVYYDQGRYDEAIGKYEEALRIAEKTVGPEHPSYAVRLGNLANVYLEQRRYDEAITKYETALRIDERTLGREHPNYAIRLSGLARVYEEQGEVQKAQELYKNALRIFEKTLPEGHPYIAQLRDSVERCGN